MEFTQEAIDEEFQRLSFNHPGFDYPLTHRRIRPSDTLILAQVIRKSHKHLRGYIGWAQYAGKWDFKQIQRFVNDHVNAERSLTRFPGHLIWAMIRLGGVRYACCKVAGVPASCP